MIRVELAVSLADAEHEAEHLALLGAAPAEWYLMSTAER